MEQGSGDADNAQPPVDARNNNDTCKGLLACRHASMLLSRPKKNSINPFFILHFVFYLWNPCEESLSHVGRGVWNFFSIICKVYELESHQMHGCDGCYLIIHCNN